jgi:hypothetical protein
LDTLPKNASCFPVFFTASELKFLEGSPFLETIDDKIKNIQIDYDMICSNVPEFA